jgi:hypothetical protein
VSAAAGAEGASSAIITGVAMHPDLAAFRHCPGCGTAGSLGFEMGKALRCAHCGFRYFHNVAVAVSAVLVHEDRMLMARRAHDPAAGQLDFPGGFVDPVPGHQFSHAPPGVAVVLQQFPQQPDQQVAAAIVVVQRYLQVQTGQGRQCRPG